MDAELQYHLPRKIEENLARGLSGGASAPRRPPGFREFRTKQEGCRDMRRVNWFEDGLQDLQYAARTLLRNPGFALIAMVTLALGIGANTAIFSVVHTTLLQPLPYARPDELVELRQTESAPGDYPLTGEDYLDWRAQNS